MLIYDSVVVRGLEDVVDLGEVFRRDVVQDQHLQLIRDRVIDGAGSRWLLLQDFLQQFFAVGIG